MHIIGVVLWPKALFIMTISMLVVAYCRLIKVLITYLKVIGFSSYFQVIKI